MFWSLENDDFKGEYCNYGRYPLLTAIFDSIQEMAPTQAGGNIFYQPTQKTTTTTVDYQLNHQTNKNGINFYTAIDSAYTV